MQRAFVKILSIYDILQSRLPFTQKGDIRNTYIELLVAMIKDCIELIT